MAGSDDSALLEVVDLTGEAIQDIATQEFDSILDQKDQVDAKEQTLEETRREIKDKKRELSELQDAEYSLEIRLSLDRSLLRRS